ncbi:uncharacterized protein LOC106646090 [Copidosoma floridanum]|uniref:uncharacterized protein LOC106646090 n=1 Tax=Copidosoma floridanum TaxID=29053 RepID=UPI000C6F9148|nr:uncharacterized protein LOC106646090 [Copidosoma floridanum]
MSCRGNLALFSGFLCIVFVSALQCDESRCKGPIRFYKELKCKAIYAKKWDCCPKRYDCTHLKGRSADFCYVNGKKYDVTSMYPTLAVLDRSGPCDENCICVRDPKGYAMISCLPPQCPHIHVKDGCFLKPRFDSCCGEVKSFIRIEETRTCGFYGTIFKYGEVFKPSDDYACQCSETKTEWGVPPMEIRENCPPVYLAGHSPYDSCAFDYRCQNVNDTVIRSSMATGESLAVPDNMKCKFGNMTLNVGDEINEGTDYNSEHVGCVCEVPPVLTCQKRQYKGDTFGSCVNA